MEKYVLRNGNNKLFIMRKGENLSDDDFSYTESGNDITVTSYIGNNTDVKVVDKFKDYYVLARPGINVYSAIITDYDFSNFDGNVILTRYEGDDVNVSAPLLEEL